MRKGVMIANKDKYINLILVHIMVLGALFLIGYFIKDAENIRKKQEECERICQPAKAVKTISLGKCICLEEELDTENKQQ
jgi:hypothetical protein